MPFIMKSCCKIKYYERKLPFILGQFFNLRIKISLTDYASIYYNLKKFLRTYFMDKTKKKELWRAVKFLLFSVSAGLIEIGSFSLLSIFLNDDYYILKSFISSAILCNSLYCSSNPSTSFKGSIASTTALASICFGNGICTKIP